MAQGQGPPSQPPPGSGVGGGGGGGNGTTYTLIQQQPPPQMHSQHSPSPPNGGPQNNNNSGNQVAYHNKDERLQQIHKKLQKKLEKRESNGAAGASSPRKGTSSMMTNNGNGEMIMHSTIPVSMVVGNKRSNNNNNVHKQQQMNQQQPGNYQTQPHHNAHPQQFQQQQQYHLNNHARILLSNNSSSGNGGRKVVMAVGKSGQGQVAKKRVANGNGHGGSSIGTSEDGEEGTSSVPEDEDYQIGLGDEDECDGEVHPAGLGNGTADYGNSNGEAGSENQPMSSAEEEVQHIKEQLSLVAGPKVSEILSRSALLQWVPPPNSETFQFNSADLFYEILLSDSAKYAKYKSIFKGQSLSCRIQDLKPGVEYSVCLRVHYQNVQGLESPTTIFNTVPCAPDAPLPPKLLTRSKNQLQLRWNVTTDNGANIQHYVLEYDCGRGMDFVEVCRTKGKQYTLTKLIPSTNYR